MNPEQLEILRDLAQSILAGVQLLETLKLHPSWKAYDVDEGVASVATYFEETRKAVWEADTVLYGTIYDLEHEALL